MSFDIFLVCSLCTCSFLFSAAFISWRNSKQDHFEIHLRYLFELILHKIIVSCILLESYIRSFLTVLPSMYFSVDSASEMKYDLVMDLSWAPVLLDPFILFNILHEAPEVTIEKKRCS